MSLGQLQSFHQHKKAVAGSEVNMVLDFELSMVTWEAVLEAGLDLLVVMSSDNICCDTLLGQELSPFGSINLSQVFVSCLEISNSTRSGLLQVRMQ